VVINEATEMPSQVKGTFCNIYRMCLRLNIVYGSDMLCNTSIISSRYEICAHNKKEKVLLYMCMKNNEYNVHVSNLYLGVVMAQHLNH
jgi:hypothetical protein